MYYNFIILILTNIILHCDASNSSNSLLRGSAVIPTSFIIYVMHKGVRKKLDVKKWKMRDIREFLQRHASGQLLNYCICEDNYGNLYAVLKSKYIERVTLEKDIFNTPLNLNISDEEFLTIHSTVPEYIEYKVDLNQAKAIMGHYHSLTIFDYVMSITRYLHANAGSARVWYGDDGDVLLMNMDNSSIHYYVLPVDEININVLSQLLEEYSLQRNKAYIPKKINHDKKDIKIEEVSMKTPTNQETTSSNNNTITINNNENISKNIPINTEISQNNPVNNQNNSTSAQ